MMGLFDSKSNTESAQLTANTNMAPAVYFSKKSTLDWALPVAALMAVVFFMKGGRRRG